MLATVIAGATLGLSGYLIEVEVDVADGGFPTCTIVGLPNKSIDEAKDRVRTAITNAGFVMPDSRITINLAPADIPKSGSAFDLPITIGILTASNSITQESLAGKMFIGELSLEGQVRKVSGIIPLILVAKEEKLKEVYIPVENAKEASIFEDVKIIPVVSLRQLVDHLRGIKKIEEYIPGPKDKKITRYSLYDFSQIKGQEQAKRALEIAAAGFHNIHLKGPPGAGKTLLSRTMPTILPLMDKDEILEVAKVYSILGELTEEIFAGVRPFRSPHHTTSRIGLIGGGSHPTPGEISLSHRGVLFLDEFPEFPRSVLESMRQPLEDGVVTVSRAAGTLTFPARFLLLAASNPCPCGFLSHPKKSCICSPGAIARYKKRLSGPLLDRIDVHIDVPPVEVDKLSEEYESEKSDVVRGRVEKARARQGLRFSALKISFNSEMRATDVKKFCKMTDGAQILLKQAVDRLALSARSYFKTIKVAQTISDLELSDNIDEAHIAEALQYRVTEL
ncbi:magnesium chelatase [Candidatus Roizmanbacteria bacterium CG11_big_fil_rev_8_21_14_0_20_36_8]|uniref:Magnesium chelatase n=2 Tax=Candidatus Roizmaniibacteriota TaxID=1752723 RepID=A0A2M6IUS1_9BACT|nr:MAG: magnesium chelatase [Candidatus Roizmanbacteria bacterium CG11_big_fil_rev_8_21_14_0_20_36_8]PIZ64942.1 MAG: magnesium chelatase [Candidatus Roizmanbacteria bacterium CG_4_10_14_0_2_um_filter_36_9]